MSALIEAENITVRYDENVVLNNVSIAIEPNDFVGFIGPNGGGKTTLLKVMLGIIAPQSGVVKVNPNLNIGYLSQKSMHEKRFPIEVQDVIVSGLCGQNGFGIKPTKQDRQRALYLMEELSIDGIAKKPFSAISGGQMQRVLLARAIVSNPELLLLDEPNTYLDQTAEKWLYAKLTELNQRMAIVLVSHDIGAVSSYVKSIACINQHLHYHQGNKITEDLLGLYNCPVELITHGHLPHRVLKTHTHQHE